MALVWVILSVVILVGFLVWGWWCPYGDELLLEKYVFATREHSLPPKYLEDTPVVASKLWVRDELLNTFSKVHSIFEAQALPYWISNTTLWGALLVKGLLPWEDKVELDMVFSHNALRKLVGVRSALHAQRLRLSKCPEGYLIHRDHFPKFPFVRIVFVGRRGERLDACAPLDELNECTFERTVPTWNESDIFPLQSVAFEHLQVPAPFASEYVVTNLYGSNSLARAPNRGNVWVNNSLQYCMRSTLM